MTKTSDQEHALLETLEELRATDFSNLDADLVANIVSIYVDTGVDAVKKAKQLQEVLVAAVGESSDAATD
jgi:hypothetical protein